MNTILTQVEESVMCDLERLMAYFDISGKTPSQIVLNKRQFNAFSRVISKSANNPTFDYAKDIDPSVPSYRGVPVISVAETRRARKKDTGDMLNEPA